jgi:hypothetical protein
MITRVWHGWTSADNAYEELLRTKILPGIHNVEYERAVIVDEAHRLLSRFDERSAHYETVLERA